MSQFSRFLITGGLAAAFHIFLRWFFSLFMIFEIAVVLAYILSVIVAFVPSKIFVFQNRSEQTKTQFAWFFFVNLVSLIVVWCVSVGLYRLVFPWVSMTWRPELVAHTIGVLSPVLVSYFLHKNLTFKEGTQS